MKAYNNKTDVYNGVLVGTSRNGVLVGTKGKIFKTVEFNSGNISALCLRAILSTTNIYIYIYIYMVLAHRAEIFTALNSTALKKKFPYCF